MPVGAASFAEALSNGAESSRPARHPEGSRSVNRVATKALRAEPEIEPRTLERPRSHRQNGPSLSWTSLDARRRIERALGGEGVIHSKSGEPDRTSE